MKQILKGRGKNKDTSLAKSPGRLYGEGGLRSLCLARRLRSGGPWDRIESEKKRGEKTREMAKENLSGLLRIFFSHFFCNFSIFLHRIFRGPHLRIPPPSTGWLDGGTVFRSHSLARQLPSRGPPAAGRGVAAAPAHTVHAQTIPSTEILKQGTGNKRTYRYRHRFLS